MEGLADSLKGAPCDGGHPGRNGSEKQEIVLMVRMSHQSRAEAECLKVIPTESSPEPVRVDKLSAERGRGRSKMILASTPMLAGQVK